MYFISHLNNPLFIKNLINLINLSAPSNFSISSILTLLTNGSNIIFNNLRNFIITYTNYILLNINKKCTYLQL